MVKKSPSKAEQRRQLARETEDYLRAGGEIRQVPRGVSGRDAEDPVSGRQPALIERGPAQPRTDLSGVVAALDARRQAMKKPARPAPKRPRKIVVYDDFGEPLREVWRDD